MVSSPSLMKSASKLPPLLLFGDFRVSLGTSCFNDERYNMMSSVYLIKQVSQAFASKI